jgi:hypothetical protein
MTVADATEERLDLGIEGVIASDGDAVSAALVYFSGVRSIVPGTSSVVGSPSTLRPVT